MTIVDEGLEELANQFKDLITQGQWGTGTTLPTTADTGLETAVGATLLTVSTGASGAASQFTHVLPSTTGNGNDLTEFELQFSNGDSLNRSVGGAITKTNSFSITTIATINFTR